MLTVLRMRTCDGGGTGVGAFRLVRRAGSSSSAAAAGRAVPGRPVRASAGSAGLRRTGAAAAAAADGDGGALGRPKGP